MSKSGAKVQARTERRLWLLAVLEVLSGELEQRAAAAVGDTPIPASELLARAWMVMQTEPVRPAVRVYFEVVGRAAAGQSPFAALAAPMTQRWIGWLEARLTGPAATRQRRAAGLLAQLDGLMLLQQMAGIHVARTAATGLGLTNSPPTTTPTRSTRTRLPTSETH